LIITIAYFERMLSEGNTSALKARYVT